MVSLLDGLPFTPYSWLMFIATALSLGLGLYSALQRTSRVGFWFSCLCLGEAIYTFGYGMELASPSVEQTHLWLTVEMLGGAFLPALIILMAYSYRYHTAPPLWLTTLLLTLSSATIAIQLGNRQHGLIFKTVELVQQQGMSISVLEFGPWFYVHMVFINVAMIVCTTLFYQCWQQAPKQHRNQVLLVLVGSLPPWIFYLIYLLGWAPANVDLSAFGFLLTGPMYGYSLFRYRFADLLPMARAQLLDQIDEGVIILDSQWRIVDSNLRAQQLFPTAHPADGHSSLPLPLRQLTSAGEEIFSQLLHLQQRDYEIQRQPLRNEQKTLMGYVVMIRDVTERVRHLAQLQTQAEIDDLTGILNRRMILQHLEQAVHQACRMPEQPPFGILLFDIDRFKSINDSQGHPIGDLILRQLASLLRQQMMYHEHFGRYGGDEFIILAHNVASTTLRERAEQLGALVQQQLNITLSMGVTLYQTHDTPHLMLQRADHALYQAKSAGRNCVCSLLELPEERVSAAGLR